MRVDKNIISNCFVIGIIFIICGIAMIVVPEDSFINDYSILQFDWNIIDLIMGESSAGNTSIGTGVSQKMIERKKEKLYYMTYDAIDKEELR